MDNQNLDPSRIMQVGMGFWASKIMLTAVNMDLFTYLAKGPKRAIEIADKLQLHQRGLYDYLDSLHALGFLKRDGIKESAVYSNSPDCDLYLDKAKPTYMGGVLKMSNNRLYPFWNRLEDGLKNGLPQNEIRDSGANLFEAIYKEEDKLREFVEAMTGVQMGNFIAFAKNFDFTAYRTLCDIGGSGAHLSAQVALNQAHMSCTSFDLPKVCKIADEILEKMPLDGRVSTHAGDFFEEDFPKADLITMGNVLHDWGEKDKKMLIGKAFEALPVNGALVVIENVIDDQRAENAFGLMLSLNMLIETPEGFDFSKNDFEKWAFAAGFAKVEQMPLTGPSSALIAHKT